MRVNERMKKVIIALLAMSILVQNAPVVALAVQEDCTHHTEHTAQCGYAEAAGGESCNYHCEICQGNEEQPQETTEAAEEPIALHQTVTGTIKVDTEGFDNDEAFAAYVERLFYGDSSVSAFAPLAGDRLTGANKILYNLMKKEIADVADGTRTSTVFSFSAAVLEESGIPFIWSETELGVPLLEEVDGAYRFNDEAQDLILDKFYGQIDVNVIFGALLSDYPYDMYWLNKEQQTLFNCSIGVGQENGELCGYIAEFIITMHVSKDYRGGDDTTVDSSKPTVAAKSAATAKSVAEANKSKTDYEKLVAYKDYICDAVSYNYAAVKPDYERGYGDPYQMIYVFDGDPTTNVVCEGYSKALQYLCDLSGPDCICAAGLFGNEDENGQHMWNIVTLNGKNYLADVTNSDTDTIGECGELFLAGNASGDVEDGYLFNPGGQSMGYIYDNLTRSLWEEDQLALAKEDYIAKPANLTAMYGDTLADVTLPEGFAWQHETTTSVGNAGPNPFRVTYTTENNEVLKDITVPLTVAKAPVTVTVTAEDKVYDGTTAATLEATVNGVFQGDTVGVEGITGQFSDANAGENKTVTIDASQAKLTGDDAANYSISDVTATTTAAITKTVANNPAAGEGYALDYSRESITVTDGYEVLDEQNAPVASGSLETYLGKTLKVRRKATDNWDASGWTSFAVADRPGAPDVSVKNETLKGQRDGAVSGVADTMEYSTNNGTSWTSVPANAVQITGLAGNTTVLVRVKATQTAPHGAVKTCTVAEGTAIAVSYVSDSQEATGMPAGLTGQSYGTKLTEPAADPTARDTNFAFYGWFKDAGCTEKWDFAKDTLTAATVTLYAKWDRVRTVTFDANGGTVTTGSMKTAAKGKLSSLPSEPVRTGYVFQGWYTAKTGGTKVTVDTIFTADATIYARWSGYAVTVAGTTNGTVTVDKTDVPAGGVVTVTVTPKSGYKLSKLTVKDENGTSYTLTAGSNGKHTFTMPAADVTVTATFISTSTNPKTGDNFQVVFWNSMIMATALGAAALLLNRKKFFGK